MNKILIALLALGSAAYAGLTPTASVAPYLVKGMALQGYDAVSYVDEQKAEKGSQDFSVKKGGAAYLFSSAKHLASFQLNPDKYLPAYGGWCAFAMARGEQVEVNPERFKIVDGRLLLFYDGLWGNTLAKWDKDEAALKAKADAWWKKLNP